MTSLSEMLLLPQTEFFEKHPETVVALAYFDMGLYDPTKAALEAIQPHLVPFHNPSR